MTLKWLGNMRIPFEDILIYTRNNHRSGFTN